MRWGQQIEKMREPRFLFPILAIAALLTTLFAMAAFGTDQQVLIQTELPQPDIPQPQMFCGYCHILTYPSVVQKGYELWKKGKHNKYGCVECHYPPKQATSPSQVPASGTTADAKHIPMKPPERFSYLHLGGETIQTRPRIVDASCMTANCHGKPDDKFKTKKIKFTEKVSFVHEAHLDKKKQIEGQQITCTSCHQHETEEKKFEVTKASCYLCHFTNAKFNEGRGKCELCHQLPEKPIQTSGQEPITHEMLKEAKVSCGSCHYELIQASGGGEYEAYFEDGELKTALVLGAGRTKKENCLACHDKAKDLKESTNKKLLHEKHVTIKNARCFECHQPITHATADLNKDIPDDKTKIDLEKPAGDQSVGDRSKRKQLAGAQSVRNSCMACHPEPHRLQLLLAAGLKREGVPKTPSFHQNARANCLACHVETKSSDKGQRVMKASSLTCVRCHKGRETLLKDWKDQLVKEINYTKGVEKEALETLAKFEPKLPEPKLVKARKMLEEGQESLNLVQFGNGVHNNKYSIMLLDAAISRFEDLMDYVKDENQ